MKPGASPREQQCSNLLTRDENESIFSLFAPRCESLATTVVQIFASTPPEHCDWTKLDAGVLCLIKDHLKRSYYFRVYCLERRSLIWEHEVYNSMQYNLSRPFLHTFEAQDCIIAFNFASEEEAHWLRGILLEKLESKKQRRERRIRSSCPKDPPNRTKTVPHSATNGVTSPANKFTERLPTPSIGLGNNTKDGKKKNKKKDDKKLTKADISTPTNFRHVSHVGWDANKGFDANLGKEESPELKEFFQQAGVSDDQLQDSATRDFIYEFIHHHGGIDRVVHEVSQQDSDDSSSASPVVEKPFDFQINFQNDKVGRESLHQRRPPPLPMRNTGQAGRVAPPPPPSRVVPAPPPPSQMPPPPPPSRAPPRAPLSGAPPPPPPPMPVAPLAPPPPPLPSTPAPDMASAGGQDPPSLDIHSALMESIRSGTTLKKVDVDSETKSNSSDSRGELLTQIRQGISLRPVQPIAKQAASGPPENSLADALAKALLERSRVIHSESSGSSDSDEDDDDEWED